MKKLFLFLTALLSLFAFSAPQPARATAEENFYYAVAPANGVWFYENPDENSGVFMIPRSYYVKVLEEGNPFCKVEYGDGQAMPLLTGYCKRESVTAVPFTPVRPYLAKRVTLTYTLDGAFEGDFNDLEKPFTYFGSTFRGTARYWYVYADGKFGYVAAESEPDFELNTDYLTSDTAITEPSVGKNPLSGVQIALACIVAVAVLCVAALIFFTRKSVPVRRDEEEIF